ncbi:inorganic polyphosphate kinase [Brenneria roseae subsp. americana]|uniref:Inorganic polyphosphate kinase n=1 Tax=Brenneria roseae subsp. americana TaxID=1508507 RepID=A0A2U1TRS4_9GAMM|nr:inorganic polyphosphate kinase [Brenneria roseae subsp. americana]PWC20421.1 inorganic polyphosphate kinase [Brenneria roseae subsp. roseae]
MLVRRVLFFTTHEILRGLALISLVAIMGIKTGVSREPVTYTQ